MAAKVATTTQGGSDSQECPGVSYASVLNPKGANVELHQREVNKDNNKENIGEVVSTTVNAKERIATQNQGSIPKVKTYQKSNRRFNSFSSTKVEKRTYHGNSTQQHERDSSKVNSDNGHERKESRQTRVNQDINIINNGDVSNDGEFQTVAPKSARRKEKLQEKYRDHHVQRERNRHHDRHPHHHHQHHPRGHSAGSKERTHKDRPERHSGEHTIINKDTKDEKDDGVTEGDGENSRPVKYVEAPLPAINPWTKSKVSTLIPPPSSSSQSTSLSTTTAATTTNPTIPIAKPAIKTSTAAAISITTSASKIVTSAPAASPKTVVSVPSPAVESISVANPDSAPSVSLNNPTPIEKKQARIEKEKRVLQPQQQQGKIFGENF